MWFLTHHSPSPFSDHPFGKKFGPVQPTMSTKKTTSMLCFLHPSNTRPHAQTQTRPCSHYDFISELYLALHSTLFASFMPHPTLHTHKLAETKFWQICIFVPFKIVTIRSKLFPLFFTYEHKRHFCKISYATRQKIFILHYLDCNTGTILAKIILELGELALWRNIIAVHADQRGKLRGYKSTTTVHLEGDFFWFFWFFF